MVSRLCYAVDNDWHSAMVQVQVQSGSKRKISSKIGNICTHRQKLLQNNKKTNRIVLRNQQNRFHLCRVLSV